MKLKSTKPAREIHEDSLKKTIAFSACDVFQGSFPCPAGLVAKVRPRRTIVRGGSRGTRGKRSVFPERHLISQFIDFVSKSQSLRKGSTFTLLPPGRSYGSS